MEITKYYILMNTQVVLEAKFSISSPSTCSSPSTYSFTFKLRMDASQLIDNKWGSFKRFCLSIQLLRWTIWMPFVMLMQALGLQLAIQFVNSLASHVIMVEVDSLNVINSLKSIIEDSSNNGTTINDCMSICCSFSI